MEIILGVVLWIILSIVAGIIASNKGRLGVGFILLSLILSPVIGIIMAILAPDNKDPGASP